MRSRVLRNTLLILAALAMSGFLLLRECASGGAMAAPYTTCNCIGIEWELYDHRPADGPRKTICIGVVESTTCYRYTDGPIGECPR